MHPAVCWLRKYARPLQANSPPFVFCLIIVPTNAPSLLLVSSREPSVQSSHVLTQSPSDQSSPATTESATSACSLAKSQSIDCSHHHWRRALVPRLRPSSMQRARIGRLTMYFATSLKPFVGLWPFSHHLSDFLLAKLASRARVRL